MQRVTLQCLCKHYFCTFVKVKFISLILSLYLITLSFTPCLEAQEKKDNVTISCCIEHSNDINESNSTNNHPIEKGCMDCNSLLSCLSSYTITTPLIEYTLFSLEDTLLPNDYHFVFNTSLISSSIWQPPKNSFFNQNLWS